DQIRDLGMEMAIRFVANHEAIVAVVNDEAGLDTFDRVAEHRFELAQPRLVRDVLGHVLVRRQELARRAGAVAENLNLAIDPAQFAVAADDAELERLGREPASVVRDRLAQPRAVVGMNEGEEALGITGIETVAGDAEEPEHLVRPFDAAVLEAAHDAADAGNALGTAQNELVLAQGFLRALKLGDVLEGAQPSDRPAFGIAPYLCFAVQHPHRAVRADDTVIERGRVFAGETL